MVVCSPHLSERRGRLIVTKLSVACCCLYCADSRVSDKNILGIGGGGGGGSCLVPPPTTCPSQSVLTQKTDVSKTDHPV
uniref:Uncharacterized protein n=1 Tax=Octopus bimaculoides TaxID=37653 RepID=A0A0L8FP48_OCTBM